MLDRSIQCSCRDRHIESVKRIDNSNEFFVPECPTRNREFEGCTNLTSPPFAPKICSLHRTRHSFYSLGLIFSMLHCCDVQSVCTILR